MFPDIAQRIRDGRAELIVDQGKKQAAVALILRDLASDPKIFFIERATNENDPWSGQIAFPGGNREAGDGSPLVTACRETEEEVGLRLLPGDLLGRLDDQQGRSRNRELPLIISCFVFRLESDQQVINNREVGDSFWMPVSHLANVENRIDYHAGHAGDPWPGISLGNQRVLWGLTWRFVQMFLKTIA